MRAAGVVTPGAGATVDRPVGPPAVSLASSTRCRSRSFCRRPTGRAAGRVPREFDPLPLPLLLPLTDRSGRRPCPSRGARCRDGM